MPDLPAKRTCTALNKAGEPCRSSPIRDADPPRCFAHAETAKSREFFGTGHPGAPGSGRPRKPRAVDILREKIENDPDGWIKPILDLRDHAVLFGTSQKTGEIVVSDTPDLAARAKAVDLAFKWVYALPKDNAELTIEPGADGGVVVRLAFDPKPEESE